MPPKRPWKTDTGFGGKTLPLPLRPTLLLPFPARRTAACLSHAREERRVECVLPRPHRPDLILPRSRQQPFRPDRPPFSLPFSLPSPLPSPLPFPSVGLPSAYRETGEGGFKKWRRRPSARAREAPVASMPKRGCRGSARAAVSIRSGSPAILPQSAGRSLSAKRLFRPLITARWPGPAAREQHAAW